MPAWTLADGPPELSLPLTLAVLSIGWLLGSFPSAALVGRAVGVDVHRAGDRNPGSTNVWRLAGPRAGLLVFVLDVLKVVLPGIAGWAAGGWWTAWAGAIGAVLGAMWPLAAPRRGGRGVGAGAGACIILAPGAAVIALAGTGLAYLALRGRAAAITVGFVSYPVAVALLSVRSTDSAWTLAGLGTLYLLLLARYVATRRRGVPADGTGR